MTTPENNQKKLTFLQKMQNRLKNLLRRFDKVSRGEREISSTDKEKSLMKNLEDELDNLN